MNVYDFDKTIYNGDSTLDFYLYCLKKHPLLVRFLPKQGFGFLLYKLKRVDKTQFKEYFYSFLQGVSDIDAEVMLFWKKNEQKMKSWYLQQKESSDVIISASPDFLLKDICARLNVRLICSRVDGHTGKYTGKNCYGEEKVRRFQAEYGNQEIKAFYSDSQSDKPMAKLAQKSYLVKQNGLEEWKL